MDLLVRLSVLFFTFIQWMYYIIKWVLVTEEKAKSVPPSDEPLLKLSATALGQKIRDRKTYSQEVVQAYIRRIQEVNQIINAVVEDRFEAALKEAREADRYIDDNPDKLRELAANKPLFGVPITIKEAIAVKGLSYTGGSLNRKNIKADKDSVVVQRLRDAGLIPILVSNTPEYCCSIETYNKIIGYTYNPYNTQYTSGGSSGGEGALLGASASVVGIGSDYGGSIRAPAVFNGVFGHKPTKRIVPLEGHWPLSTEDLYRDFMTIGPMARYAEDLTPMLKIMSGANADVLKLNQEVDLSKVQIFYMEDTGNNFCLPETEKEIRTAVKVAAAYLSRECHCHVSNHKFKELADSIEIISGNLMSIKKYPSPLDDTKVKYNAFVEIFKSLLGKSKFSMHELLFDASFKINKVLSFNTEKSKQKLEVLKKVLEDGLGDNGVLIYPCTPSSAFKLGGYFALYPNCHYSAIINVTGLPATALPVGFDAKKLPVGIQIIAGPNQDRLTLAVAQELEKCFGGWQPVP